jgi:hypothetical protein
MMQLHLHCWHAEYIRYLYQEIPGTKFCLAPTIFNDVSIGLTTFNRLNNRRTLQNHNRNSNLLAATSGHTLLQLKTPWLNERNYQTFTRCFLADFKWRFEWNVQFCTCFWVWSIFYTLRSDFKSTMTLQCRFSYSNLKYWNTRQFSHSPLCNKESETRNSLFRPTEKRTMWTISLAYDIITRRKYLKEVFVAVVICLAQMIKYAKFQSK